MLWGKIHKKSIKQGRGMEELWGTATHQPIDGMILLKIQLFMESNIYLRNNSTDTDGMISSIVLACLVVKS